MWTMPVAHCLLVWICRNTLTPHHVLVMLQGGNAGHETSQNP